MFVDEVTLGFTSCLVLDETSLGGLYNSLLSLSNPLL